MVAGIVNIQLLPTPWTGTQVEVEDGLLPLLIRITMNGDHQVAPSLVIRDLMTHPRSCNAMCQFVFSNPKPLILCHLSVAASCAYALVSIDPQPAGTPFHTHQSMFWRSFIQRQH